MAAAALLFDEVFQEHDTGHGHPERPERMEAIGRALEREGLLERFDRLAPRPATEEDLLLCHERPYVALAKREIEAGYPQLSTGDTAVGARSYEVATLAAGAALEAVDAVCGGSAQRALAVVRPPGHHARPAQGMGFCIFNNIAIAARYAQRRHGVERVAIADWDVHHGNGTQDIFYGDGSVFFFSTHQSPWYPGTGAAHETGEGPGRGSTLNRPFPAGAGRQEILGAFRQDFLPAMQDFRPQLLLISAGFDSRRGDPLGGFLLADEDFRELTEILREIAGAHAEGRVVSLLEGGYNLAGLASATVAHARALCDA